MNETAEVIRLRYKYRRLLMEGRISLPLEAAARLMGPDCAYHLYFTVGVEKSPVDEAHPAKPHGSSRRKKRSS